MKTIKNLVNLFTFVLFVAFLAGCKDDTVEAVSEQEEVDIASQSTSHDAVIDIEIQAITELMAEHEGGRVGAGCVTVTRDEAGKTVTLDFGDGCVGPYGRERSGQIIITYGGIFGDHLANRVITFHNYYVNNKKITGTIELRDFNLDGEGHLTLTRKHMDLKIIFPDGNHFTSNGTTTITWLSGEGDEDPTNDVFQITGSYEGVSTRGRRVTRVITEPILVDFNCLADGGFALIGGKIEVTIAGGHRDRLRVVDYGDGTCDSTIVVTINGKVFTITVS